MAADLRLPREAWQDHPNYPHNLLLLRSHESFRIVNERLVDRASRGGSREAVVAVFDWWKTGMHGHEHYEEAKLYPFLEHRWGVNCDVLTEGHAALAEADRRVREASQEELEQALRAHRDVLLDHLDLEERMVVPALLALTRAEFDAYSQSSLRRLLREVPCHADQGCRACA